MKDKFTKMIKGLSEAKDQATKVGKDAVTGAKIVKDVLKTGVDVSKGALKKAQGLITPEKISQGIEAAGQGMSIAAKGAKLASKGAEKVAETLEKASESATRAGRKIKNKV